MGPGTVVDLTLAPLQKQGTPLATVPALQGMSDVEARTTLSDKGLQEGSRSGPYTGMVFAQKPSAGERVRRGTAVHLFFSAAAPVLPATTEHWPILWIAASIVILCGVLLTLLLRKRVPSAIPPAAFNLEDRPGRARYRSSLLREPQVTVHFSLRDRRSGPVLRTSLPPRVRTERTRA